MKRFILTVVILNVLCSGVIFAEPFNAALVSSEAGWVLHADYDAFRQTTLAQCIRTRLQQHDIEQKMQTFKRIFSFHPIDDVSSVLFYGTDADPNGATVLITAKFDRNILLSLLENPQTFTHNQHTIYSWQNQDGPRKGLTEYGAFYGQDRIVMGGTIDTVKKAIDVLDGLAPNAAGNSFMSDVKPAPGRFLYIQADRLGQLVENKPNAVMLRETEHLLFTAGEDKGIFSLQTAMTIPSPQKLVEIEQVLRGMLAYGLLATGQKSPALAAALSAIKIETGQNILSISFSYDSRELAELLDKAAQNRLDSDKVSKMHHRFWNEKIKADEKG